MTIMTRLVITTETKDILKKRTKELFYKNMIFITEDDIVFNIDVDTYYSVKTLCMHLGEDGHKRQKFFNKYPYFGRGQVGHYWTLGRGGGHFYWTMSKCLTPIYNYGLIRDSDSNTIDEIIRDYSKVQEDQKMLHFHVTDVAFRYQ